mmetsp:Transcript_24246/g.30848  ORF Transcript_24246/g.30848 Transcript_24246/m.30848 type:complete len:439 (-) Transcript_24246:1792-3108(-)
MEEKVQHTFFSHHCPDTARLNNGSFGAIPSTVLSCRDKYRDWWLSQPDDLYFNELQPQQIVAKQMVAKMINTDAKRVSLINNATMAGAIASQKIMWDLMQQKSSHAPQYVLQFDICYLAVRKSVEAFIIRAGAELLEVKIPFPFQNDSELVDAVENALKSVPKGSIKIAFLDHITSVPAIVFPLKEIVQKCREYEVQEIFVDGAHAVGQVPLDMKELQVDYYTSNLHKWMFAATGCAFLYCSERVDNPANASTAHNATPSFFYNQTLSEETKWAGTDDYTGRLAIPEALRFYSVMGHVLEKKDPTMLDIPYNELVERFQLEGTEFPVHMGVARHNKQRLQKIAQQLADSWNASITTPLSNITGLVNLELPNKEPFASIRSMPDAEKLRHYIRENYKIEVFVFASSSGCFVRLSCQIYNTSEDYRRLDAVMNQLLTDGN